MIIIPIRGKDVDFLKGENDVFDLIMNESHEQYYLIIQGNTVTWIGEGTIPGELAVQLKSRSTTMNGKLENPKNLGNIGFLGTYPNLNEALNKLYPHNGFAVSNMKYVRYTGQALTAKELHILLIKPLLCLLGYNPASDLQQLFQSRGWGKQFSCSGTWDYMRLYIGDRAVSTLEEWFNEYCRIGLNTPVSGSASASAEKTEAKSGSKVTGFLAGIFWIIVLIVILRSCS